MKTFRASVCMIALALFCVALVPAPKAPAPYVQPEDNKIREIVVTAVPDGDTVTATVFGFKLGGVSMEAHGVRLRLKGVSTAEIGEGSEQDRAVANASREALAARVFGATKLTARLYARQTHDRYEAILYDEKGDINSFMRTFPQGGTGVKK